MDSLKKFVDGLNLDIRSRLIFGFSAVALALAVAVGTTLWQVSKAETLNQRIVDLRVPTAFASSGLVNNINASLASLRGWMLTGNPSFKTERAAVWADIALIRADMDRLSAHWTVPANIEKWNGFKATLDEFEVAQRQVEDIAHTADEHPANRILFEDAAPRASVIIQSITAMINAEADLPATPERKALLGMMADVRGSMGMGLANIRAYLLSGDEKFKALFDKFWATNERRFADLTNNASLFTAQQQSSFGSLVEARNEFAPLPPEMFAIRGSKKWNMANFTLITEAAPRAGKLLGILAGDKRDNGTRSGGMVANQKKLLAVDADTTAENASVLKAIEWVLLLVGLGIAAIVTFLTSRSIVDPVKTMTAAMGKLAQGDTSIDVPARERTDELGAMAAAMQVFKDAALENERMTATQKEERQAQEKRASRLEELTQTFDSQISSALENVDSATNTMTITAESMASTAEETSNQSQAAAAASEQASNNVQMVSAAAEEMSASVEEIARQVGESAQMAQSAVEQAETTNNEVQGLVETAQKIGYVVEMITDIAAQTNLLALNATIEAARAGEAGKGFAVVATEVKSLANQTAKATDEIAEQISAMQGATTNSVEAIQAIVNKISEMNEVSSAIAAAIDEQEAATRNISENSQQAATGTQEATSNVAGVSEAASETGVAASEVLRAAGTMSDEAKTLRESVSSFLSDVKVA